MKILVFVGSLRRESFGRKIAAAVEDAASDGMAIEVTDGRDLPHYDQDLDVEAKPPGVQALLDRVTAADGLVFLTPEYNYGIPGALKNAIDWASRPAFQSPLKGKPALVIGYSLAPTGGARAHAQLTMVLSGTLTPVYLAPSFLVPAVHEKFDEGGTLTDELTRRRLGSTLEAFQTWATAQTS